MSLEDYSHIQKLEDFTSFELWKFEIKIHLKASGLSEIIEGKSLLSDMKTEKEKKAWQLQDSKAQKMIVFTVDKSMLVHIMECKTGKEMYDTLLDIYERDTMQQKHELLKKFYDFKFEKDCDVIRNIGELKLIANRLNVLKQNVDDNMIITKIISILPESYKVFKTAWESTSTAEKTLKNLISRLVIEESSHTKEQEEQAVSFKAEREHVKKCFKCGKENHIARDCPQKKPVCCQICKKNNHVEKDCYFRRDKGNTPKPNRLFCGICKKNNHEEKSCYYNKNKKNIEADVEALALDELCKICMDAPIECILLECGHMATCTSCGKQLCECPICRQLVIRCVQTFKA